MPKCLLELISIPMIHSTEVIAYRSPEGPRFSRRGRSLSAAVDPLEIRPAASLNNHQHLLTDGNNCILPIKRSGRSGRVVASLHLEERSGSEI